MMGMGFTKTVKKIGKNYVLPGLGLAAKVALPIAMKMAFSKMAGGALVPAGRMPSRPSRPPMPQRGMGCRRRRY
jgi:hypothetical protein